MFRRDGVKEVAQCFLKGMAGGFEGVMVSTFGSPSTCQGLQDRRVCYFISAPSSVAVPINSALLLQLRQWSLVEVPTQSHMSAQLPLVVRAIWAASGRVGEGFWSPEKWLRGDRYQESVLHSWKELTDKEQGCLRTRSWEKKQQQPKSLESEIEVQQGKCWKIPQEDSFG